ncbi:sugar dehydrogenase complex small subunit [Rahnella sp. PCH160]|uniref:sugar dehydrogenase complex small subunit n=1 Tax=Rahnella sp. PCH160 TaxID=3447928 RepID=UPI0039FBA34F
MTDILGRLTRRRLLQGMGVLAATTLIPTGVLPAYASSAISNDFITISIFLTGRDKLSADYSTALYSALTKFDTTIASKLSHLRAYIDANSIKAADLKNRLSTDPAVADLVGLPGLLLTGWYLGIVGSGDNAICVTYVDALANKEVADVLRPPSYAYGAYGSWAAKPV